MRQKWVLACQSFGECTARVKLELTDFSMNFQNPLINPKQEEAAAKANIKTSSIETMLYFL